MSCLLRRRLFGMTCESCRRLFLFLIFGAILESVRRVFVFLPLINCFKPPRAAALTGFPSRISPKNEVPARSNFFPVALAKGFKSGTNRRANEPSKPPIP